MVLWWVVNYVLIYMLLWWIVNYILMYNILGLVVNYVLIYNMLLWCVVNYILMYNILGWVVNYITIEHATWIGYWTSSCEHVCVWSSSKQRHFLIDYNFPHDSQRFVLLIIMVLCARLFFSIATLIIIYSKLWISCITMLVQYHASTVKPVWHGHWNAYMHSLGHLITTQAYRDSPVQC